MCTLFVYTDAVKTYYNSMATTRRLKASGKYKDKVTKQRKKNRKSNVCSKFKFAGNTRWQKFPFIEIKAAIVNTGKD